MKKPFELSVILAVMNDCEFLNATEEKKLQLVSHITRQKVTEYDPETFEAAIEYLREYHPKLAAVADSVAHLVPDQPRYNVMIDLYRKIHEVAPMEFVPA